MTATTKQVSDDTQIAVCGYIRESQQLLPCEKNVYFTIPTTITNCILLYLHNYYNNEGFYRWKIINTNTINEMLNCKCGTIYKSEPFEMSRLGWQIEIYPNGNKPELTGYFVIHLRLLSNIQSISKISFARIFRVLEIQSGAPWLEEVNNTFEYDYWTRKCPLSCLKNIHPQTITIEIYLNIVRICLDSALRNDTSMISRNSAKNPIQTKQRMVYQLDKNDMAHFVNSEMGKSMCSDMLNDMWVLEIHPNGRLVRHTGHVSAYLHLMKLPNNFDYDYVKTKYSLLCKETGHITYMRYSFTFHKSSYGPDMFIEFKSVKDMNMLTFIVDMEILELGHNGKIIDMETVGNESEISYYVSK